jgi:hypothetical protein
MVCSERLQQAMDTGRMKHPHPAYQQRRNRGGGHGKATLDAGRGQAGPHAAPAAAAARTGRSLRAVYLRRHALGVGAVSHWTPGEDELVRTLPVKEAARRTAHTLRAVYVRRRALGVARRHQG